MRGEVVNIDKLHANLNSMKKQLESKSKDTDPTIQRENYVNNRRRRASTKRIREMIANEQSVRQKLNDQKTAQAESDVEGSEPILVHLDDLAFDNDGFEATEEVEVAPVVAQEKPQTVTKTRVIKK